MLVARDSDDQLLQLHVIADSCYHVRMSRRVRVVGSDGTVLREIQHEDLLKILLRPVIETFEAGGRPVIKTCEACRSPVHVPSKGTIPRICTRCRTNHGLKECAGHDGYVCHAKVPRRAMLLGKIKRRKGLPWRCVGCANSWKMSMWTPEERALHAQRSRDAIMASYRAGTRKSAGFMTLSAEERARIGRDYMLTLSAEERSERGRLGGRAGGEARWANVSPEERRALMSDLKRRGRAAKKAKS